MIDFCQNKAVSNKVIPLNLSVTSPVIRRIPMFVSCIPLFSRVSQANLQVFRGKETVQKTVRVVPSP